MGAASQGEGYGKGSGGHQAKGVKMGMRRVPHHGPAPFPVNPPVLPGAKPPTPPAPPEKP